MSKGRKDSCVVLTMTLILLALYAAVQGCISFNTFNVRVIVRPASQPEKP